MYLCWYSWRPPQKCFILHDLSKYNTCTLKFMFFSRLLEIVKKCIFLSFHSPINTLQNGKTKLLYATVPYLGVL